MLRCVLLAAAVGALALGAAPAQAASLSWSDPAGDATRFAIYEVETSRPTNDALDIVSSTLSSDGSTLAWVVKLKDLPDQGYPDGVNGFYFRLGFTWDDSTYEFQLHESGSPGDIAPSWGFGFWYSTDSGRSITFGRSYLPCRGCTGVIDRDTDSVIVSASVAAMAESLKQHESHDTAFSQGSQLTEISVVAQRHIGSILTPTADIAEPPKGTIFTV